MYKFNLTNIVFELDWMKILNDAIQLQVNQEYTTEQNLAAHRDLCIDAYSYLSTLKQSFLYRNERKVVEQIQKHLLNLSKCLMFITRELAEYEDR